MVTVGRVNRFFATVALLPLALAVLVPASGGCAATSDASSDKICTAGNYVFCRCQNRDEGTKLCNPDGQTFAACLPCPDDPAPGPDYNGPNPEPISQDGGGLMSIDSSTPPPVGDAGPAIDAKCIGKLAVVAGVATDVYTAIFTGDRSFDVSVSHGPGLKSPASIAALNGTLVAVYRSNDALVETEFKSSWSPPAAIGQAAAASPATPTLTVSGSALKMVYVGADNQFYLGTYANGWDDANTLIDGSDAGADVPGRSAPSAASVGTSLVFGFSGSDGTLNRQMLSGSAWGAIIKVPSATALPVAPAMMAFDGGTKDVMMAYVGSDQALHSVTREASNKAWNSAILIDDGARPGDASGGIADTFSMAPMTGGRAMLVYRGTNGLPFYSVYDPTLAKPWSAPAELIAGANPTVSSTPVVAEGRCGEDAVVAYAVKDGAVAIARFVGGAWNGPYVVGGMTNLDYVGVGEMP